MTRMKRIQSAQDTLQIIQTGRYQPDDRPAISLAGDIDACKQGTVLWLPEDLQRLHRQQIALPAEAAGVIEVANETTLDGARRLAQSGEDVPAVLNFASARNAGGGFLRGAHAQEESLARSSALYASLTTPQAAPYYETHRAQSCLLYSDRTIWSPACPVFRDDKGRLLRHPYRVDFVTSAAPNAGAIATNQAEKLGLIDAAFEQRLHAVLALCAHHGKRRLVLGAWGCGVFANDIHKVAALFAAALLPGGPYWRRFDHVLFSVLDGGKTKPTTDIFRQALMPAPVPH